MKYSGLIKATLLFGKQKIFWPILFTIAFIVSFVDFLLGDKTLGRYVYGISIAYFITYYLLLFFIGKKIDSKNRQDKIGESNSIEEIDNNFNLLIKKFEIIMKLIVNTFVIFCFGMLFANILLTISYNISTTSWLNDVIIITSVITFASLTINMIGVILFYFQYKKV